MTNNYHPLQIGNYNYRFEMGILKQDRQRIAMTTLMVMTAYWKA